MGWNWLDKADFDDSKKHLDSLNREHHTVHISIGGRVGDIGGKVGGIF